MLAARHGGDDRGVPQQDAGGGRPRYNIQRPQGVRSLRIGQRDLKIGGCYKQGLAKS